MPGPTSAPHSYLHARYAWGPILAINAWRTLFRRNVQERLIKGRPMAPSHPHCTMSLCDGHSMKAERL